MTAAFAFGYNVGDVHVFFLPSHLMLVLLAACGVVAIARAAGRAVPSHSRPVTALILACLVAYPVWRVWDTYPAVDRSADVRPERALDQLTDGLDGVNDIFAADLNWQLQNGLAFYSQHQKPGLSYFRLAEHLLQAPFIVHDNRASGRDVVLSEGSAARLLAAFGPRYTVTPDTRVDTPELTASVVAIPRGTIYALTRLRPTRDHFLDARELDTIVRHLSGSAIDAVPEGDYLTIVGVLGRAAHARAGLVPSISRATTSVRAGRRRAHGIVALHRHDPPRRVRPRDRQSPPRADRGTGTQPGDTRTGRIGDRTDLRGEHLPASKPFHDPLAASGQGDRQRQCPNHG